MNVELALLLLSTFTVFHLEVNSQQCSGPIGTNNEVEHSDVRENRFYLNTAAPAPCSGTITEGRVCYYKPGNAGNNRNYYAAVAVYREMIDDPGQYEIISEMFGISYTSTQIKDENRDLVCNTFDVSPDFDIEAGDVFGACVFDPPGGRQRRLEIVGDESGYSLMEMSSSDCSRTSIPSTISSSALSNVDSRLLHVYANITNVPTPPPTTTMPPPEQTTWTAPDTTTAAAIDDITTTTAVHTTTASHEPTTMSAKTDESTTAISNTATTNGEKTATMNSEKNEAYSTATPDAVYTSTDSGGTNAALGDTNSAGSGGVVAGVVVLVLALSIVAVVTTVILVIVFKKRSGGHYLQSRKSLEQTGENGVSNCTYDTGFSNPAVSYAAGCSLYDEIRIPGSQSTKAGEENYYELNESRFTNTYECVATDIYSELTDLCTDKTQSEGQNITEGNIYDLEDFYSTPDDPQTSLSYLLERNKQEDIYGDLNAYYAPASEENEIYSQLQTCGVTNISHTQIKITGHLGSGQFGIVEKGTWQGKEVALKTLKEGSDEEDKVKFLQEAAIMAQFRHPNIVTLHGVVSDREPLMLVVELIHRGDLRDYLHTLRPDPGELPVGNLPMILLSFSQQVALGMQYLSSKRFVHRDLAARNILVSKDNICKVADFGMSRDLADETYYVSHGGMIPVKWTAPEAIHYKKYSTASDVWSYGCLLYEIWSLGYKPYEELKNIEVIRMVDSNKRLSPPPGCPRVIYEAMIKCWNPVAGSRPGFRELTIGLTGNQSDVLSVPQDDLCTHKLAGVLGAPIAAAKDMYLDLKNIYT